MSYRQALASEWVNAVPSTSALTLKANQAKLRQFQLRKHDQVVATVTVVTAANRFKHLLLKNNTIASSGVVSI